MLGISAQNLRSERNITDFYPEHNLFYLRMGNENTHKLRNLI